MIIVPRKKNYAFIMLHYFIFYFKPEKVHIQTLNGVQIQLEGEPIG